jgi:hypothetical protein
VNRPSFGGARSAGEDYARYEIYKLSQANPAGVRVEAVIGLKKAKGRIGFLMRGLPKDGETRYEIRPVSGVGQGRMAWGN